MALGVVCTPLTRNIGLRGSVATQEECTRTLDAVKYGNEKEGMVGDRGFSLGHY